MAKQAATLTSPSPEARLHETETLVPPAPAAEPDMLLVNDLNGASQLARAARKSTGLVQHVKSPAEAESDDALIAALETFSRRLESKAQRANGAAHAAAAVKIRNQAEALAEARDTSSRQTALADIERTLQELRGVLGEDETAPPFLD